MEVEPPGDRPRRSGAPPNGLASSSSSRHRVEDTAAADAAPASVRSSGKRLPPAGLQRRRSGLLAIVYSEFDNTLGPTIRYQAPEGCVRAWGITVCVQPIDPIPPFTYTQQTPRSFLSQELFDGISDYVITGRQLYGRVVAVATADCQVLGCPLAIENEKVR